MSDFKHYLQKYEVDAVTLSIAANIRYQIAWNALQGEPIPPEDAQKIKAAVLTLTHVAYTGSFHICNVRHLSYKRGNISCKNM